MRLSTLQLVCALLLTTALGGCFFEHMNRDASVRPDTAVGTRATILMPGQTAPPMPPYAQGSGATTSSQSSAPGTVSGQGSSSQSGMSRGGGGPAGPPVGAPRGGAQPAPEGEDDGITMLGGVSEEGDASSKVRETPIVGPLLTIFGYPFWLFGRSTEEKADDQATERAREGANLPPAPPSFARAPDEAERYRIQQENERIRQQLLQRRAASEGAAATPSIRDELAALERSLGGPRPGAGGAEGRLGGETRDRDGDGLPDRWEYDQDRGTREVLDQDHDGRADRVVYYDESHRILRTEEDLDGDGSLETVSHYMNGELARRRADSNGDGQSDSWSFFRAGELVRHELDRDGDGFRDLVLVYSAGEMVREEEDRNRDGRPDRISHYRDGEIVEKHEDLDYDGLPDIASYYEGGRLVRRSISSEEALEAWSSKAGS